MKSLYGPLPMQERIVKVGATHLPELGEGMRVSAIA
jgi:hypothetical protein